MSRSGSAGVPALTASRWPPRPPRPSPRPAAASAQRPYERCSTCCVARPGGDPQWGPGRWAAGVRDRRHHPQRGRHPANHRVYTTQPGNHGGSGYPLLRLVALVACGTRSLIAAVYGPTSSGETTLADRLAASLHTGMLVLCDRNLTTHTLTGRIAAAHAHLLGRCKANRKLPLVGRLHDGSYLSVLGGVTVGVIDAEITIATRAGRASGSYRLATTLTDAHTWPATTQVTLDHQRWEIETAYLALKSSILGGRVLRAAPPPASTKRSMPCWSATSSCASPWPMPPAPNPASTPTGPASPSPSTPPATSSSRPPA